MNEMTYEIRNAIYAVHNTLGPGLFESVYQAALTYELLNSFKRVEVQLAIPVNYKEITLDVGFRLDILVEDQVIIEIKSIESLQKVHKKQLLTYLKLSKKRIGYLVNFNSSSLVDGDSLIRLINGY